MGFWWDESLIPCPPVPPLSPTLSLQIICHLKKLIKDPLISISVPCMCMGLGKCWGMGSLLGPASLTKTDFLPQQPSLADSSPSRGWDFTRFSCILYLQMSGSFNAPQKGFFLLRVINTDTKPDNVQRIRNSGELRSKQDLSITPLPLRLRDHHGRGGQKDF